MAIGLLIYVFLLRFEIRTAKTLYTNQPEYKLIEKLFNDKRGYNRNVRPTLGYHEPIKVHVSVNLVTLYSLNERRQTFSSAAWIDLSWQDQHFAWNKTEFTDVKSILVPMKRIWIPDICITNAVTNDKCLLGSEFGQVLLEYSGKVTLWRYRDIHTICNVDITLFPFDQQTCSIRIGTFYSEDEKLSLLPLYDIVDLRNYVHNEEWKMIKSFVRKKHLTFDKNFTELEFTFVLVRKPLFHLYSTVLPILILSILNMVCFMVPIESGEKIGMTLAIFLSFAVFITLISEMAPRSGENVFIFGVFMVVHLLMSGLTILLEVIVLNIYHKPKDMKMKAMYIWLFKKLCNQEKKTIVKEKASIIGEVLVQITNGSTLWWNKEARHQNNHAGNKNEVEAEREEPEDWQKLATGLDNVFGCVVITINALLILIFFVLVNTL